MKKVNETKKKIIQVFSACMVCLLLSNTVSAIMPGFIDAIECKGLKENSITFESWNGLVNQTRWAIDYAARQWNNGTGVTKLYHSSTQHANNIDSQRDGHNRITKVAFEAGNDAAMTTHLWGEVRNGYTYVIEADIMINSTLPWNNTGGANFYDVQNCITHELGHMLGLGHALNPDPTMYYICAIGETKKRTIEQEDMNGFFNLYG